MSALVSVIVPVYNLENYIGNCIEKLLCQTYKNMEIICVDDGSTDSSAEKIKSYAEKDSRVYYVRQENAGVSSARNTGMRTAKGEYLMFVDGDDYLHYQAIEIFVNAIVKNDVDMVCAHQQCTTVLSEPMQPITDYNVHEATHRDLFRPVNNNVIGKSSCAKLIRREIALKAQFPRNITNGEDANYVIHLLSENVSFNVIDKVLYYYYTRENSCVTSKFSKSKFTVTLSFDDLCELLKNTDHRFLRGYCLQYLFQTIFYNRTLSIGTDSEEYVIKESKRIGKKWIKDFISCTDIDVKIRLLFTVFFYSRQLYELARMIQDPTMKDFYKSRKQDRKD